MLANAFTCTGSYAILILYGIKRTENRSAWPEPREGRGGDFVFQVVLQGRVRTVHRVGVGESAAGGFREAAVLARGEGLARQGRRRVRLQGKPPTNQSINHILGRRLSVLVGLVECRAPARADSLPRQRRHVVAPSIYRPIGS